MVRYYMTMYMTMVIWSSYRVRIMQTLKASEFKARCLKLMDEVQKTGAEIVITKNGKPVSKLVPYRVQASTLLGLHKDKISSLDNDNFSTGESWNADR